MKVLLLKPPMYYAKVSIKRCTTPLGLAYTAAVLEKHGIKVKILDCYLEGYENVSEAFPGYVKVGLDDKDIKKVISEYNPDFVGITCVLSSEISNVFSVAKLTKEVNPGIKVVLGGLHPSLYPLQTMQACPEIDYIILGEGEYRFLELLKGNTEIDGIAIAKNKEIRLPTNKIEDLNKLPFPARHLLNMKKYIKINKCISPYPKKSRTEQVLATRGCPCNCFFCSTPRFVGHKLRVRTPKNVVTEMKHLIDQYGIEEIQFNDDNMTANSKYAIELFKSMKPLGIVFCMANGTMVNSLNKEVIHTMKQAGCYQITFSVESGSQNTLKFMRKSVNLERVKPLVKYAQSLGISCHVTMILGMPGETLEDAKKTFKFANYCCFDSASFFMICPIPGSDLYEFCKEKGYLYEDSLFEKFRFTDVTFKNPDYPAEYINELISKETTKFVRGNMIRHPIKAFKKYAQFIKRNPKEIIKILGRVT